MTGLKSSLAAGVVALVLGACAGPDQAPAPLLREAARQNRIGEEAYLRGDHRHAEPALVECVRLHLAAGDIPGAVLALVNEVLEERTTDPAKAAATAKRLSDLLPAAVQQSPDQAGNLTIAVGWINGSLALDAGDAVAAAQASDVFVPARASVADRWEARLENLRADIALHQNRNAEAVTSAQSARRFAAKAKDVAEEARACRLSGTAHRALSQWNESRTDLLAAVHLEQELGGGSRMAGDLKILADVSEHLGDSSSAALYRQRADAIGSAR
ncbi:MAG TPA: hypothetical protein VHD32_17595 [Candidatus Didemnitutus sp.]|nr:hypothetical protein [Candidatus Didemnitutus sp.]